MNEDEKTAVSGAIQIFQKMPIKRLRQIIRSLKKQKTVETKEVIDIIQLIINKKKIKT